MIKFIKNYGVYVLETIFLAMFFGFAYFLLMLFQENKMKIKKLFTKSDLIFIKTIFDFYITNLAEEYKKGDNLETFNQILSIRNKCVSRISNEHEREKHDQ